MNGLVRTFLAPSCAGCRTVLDRPLASPVCDACWRAVVRLTPPLCEICGDQDSGVLDRQLGNPAVVICARCAAHPPSFSVARSAGCYDGPLRDVIHAFKYQARRPLARFLAPLLLEAGTGVLDDADAVVPVPLHPWRALRRGFNQADDLAVHLRRPVWRALRRTRHGPPQATLPAHLREANAGRAFAYGSALGLLAPCWRRTLKNRVVVVIDDVMTTGATIEACSAALLEAGVRDVRALTVARAVAARPPAPRARPPRAAAPR